MVRSSSGRGLYGRRQALRRRLAVGLLWSLLIILVVGVGAAGGIFLAFLRDLPSLEGLEEYQPSVATTLYADQDEPFTSFYEQRRILIPLAKIPAHLQRAVLATEDAGFYEHRGLSMRGILRALAANLLQRRRAQGGSTITQQLARILFLTPEKSLSRKIKEALLAVEIDQRYSKERILELYFNQIYFGHGAYGVEAAAQTYFKKSATEVTLDEAAMLAGLPNAPNRFSPILDPTRARRRRAHVLNRMADEGYITPAQAEEAGRAPFPETLFTRAGTLAPYYVEHVRQLLEERYGAYALYNSGLKVYTTLSLKAQRAAEEAMIGGLRDLDKSRGYRPLKSPPGAAARSSLGPYTPRVGDVMQGTVLAAKPGGLEVQVGRYRGELPLARMEWAKLPDPGAAFRPGDAVLVRAVAVDEAKRSLALALEQEPELEGALLALDPRDGAIKAMVGGYSFARSKFNRALQARRQPGSAFKPFIYAAAFDQGLTPSTVIEDSPISFHTRIGGELVEWGPRNFDRKFHGPTTLRRALEQSVNVVTVKLLQQVGVDRVVALARQLGVESELRREVALALGVSEVTMLELVSAYGVLANGGLRAEPFAIRKVTDSQGRILEGHLPEVQPALKPETAYVLTNVMKGVVERGTGARARVLGRPLAGKTGTTDDATDLWFVGFSPQLVAGVWLGYDVKRSLGSAETGGRMALPLWIAFMQKALEGLPPDDFPVPEGVVPLRVQLQTGRPAGPGEPGSILEYFVRGTEPKPAPPGAALGLPAASAAKSTAPAKGPAPSPPPSPVASPPAPAPGPPPGPAPVPAEAAQLPRVNAPPPAAPPAPRIPPAELPPQAGQR